VTGRVGFLTQAPLSDLRDRELAHGLLVAGATLYGSDDHGAAAARVLDLLAAIGFGPGVDQSVARFLAALSALWPVLPEDGAQ